MRRLLARFSLCLSLFDKVETIIKRMIDAIIALNWNELVWNIQQ
ncbi:Hypothetical protein ABZS17D1_02426 [Kosakonia cowanii]